MELRTRRSGDRFCPLGMGGHTTAISEFMINVKVPRHLRHGWPLLLGNSGIAWVCGLRVDQRAAVTPATSAAWVIEIRSPWQA
jgi:tRNA(Ile)-lysidine synthase